MNDSEKIKELIRIRNWSQNTFAKETGVAQSYISYLINGKQKISEKVAKKICDALEIDISYFIEPKEEIKPEEQKEAEKSQETAKGLSIEDGETYGDIIEIAIKITELRNQLLEKIKIDRDKDKYYNGIDQDFLHHVENLDKLSDKQAIDIILKEKESRKNRRTVKNRIFILQNILNTMTNPNLYQFVVYGINKTKNFEYKPRSEMNNNETNGNL